MKVKFLLIAILLTACTKIEYRSIELKGDLILKVSTYSETGKPIYDKGGIKAELTGAASVITAITDTSGRCVIPNVSLGNYILTLSKEGYGTNTYENFGFTGASGKDSIRNCFLIKRSSIVIKSLDLTQSGQKLYLSGTISHLFPRSEFVSYPYYWPLMIAYIGKTQDVSQENHLAEMTFYSDRITDTIYNAGITLGTSLFPSGTRVYAMVQGKNIFNGSRFNFQKGMIYDPTLGNPSEVKSITLTY